MQTPGDRKGREAWSIAVAAGVTETEHDLATE